MTQMSHNAEKHILKDEHVCLHANYMSLVLSLLKV